MTRTSHAPRRTATCRHCGTPFRPTEREAEYCCAGCRFVHHLLHKRGFESFYRLGGRPAPVGGAVFQEQTWEWLRARQSEAEAAGSPASLELRIQGISCAGCVWLIETVFMERRGALSCRVHSPSGSVCLRWEAGSLDLAAFAADVRQFGYALADREAGGGAAQRMSGELGRRLGVCGALALNAMLFALPRYLGIDEGDRLVTLFDTGGFLLASASMAVGGTFFFRRAWAALRRGDLHIDLPISIGLLAAYAGSAYAWRAGSPGLAYFEFVSTFTFLMLLGRWLQERSVESNRQRLLGLQLSGENLRVRRDGVEVEAASLVAGQDFHVASGGLVPVRSRLVGDAGVFALQWISGEPAPRAYPGGAIVPSGARNIGAAPVGCVALESWPDAMLSRLLALGNARGWRDVGLQRLIRTYLSCVLVLGMAGFVAWGLVGGDWAMALHVFVSVLVVSCPCAIGVALPLLDDVAAARLQSCGVYLREHSLWARLRRVRAILFDKTGTLTIENLCLANPEALEALTPQACRAMLALVQHSLHPVASCLREHLLAAGYEADTAANPRELVGFGIEREEACGVWRLGRASWAAPASGARGTVFALDGVVLAELAFREELRPEAAAQVRAFRRGGYEVCVLSGDEPARVTALAGALGLPPAAGMGGLTPDDKAALVRDRWPASALVLGDGANDSLAFDAALCRGTPNADSGLLENKADFYLLGRGLGGLGEMFRAAARRRRTRITVFIAALCYNAAAVSAALAGVMSPLVAAVIMPLSSLAAVGLVFLFFKPGKQTSLPNEN